MVWRKSIYGKPALESVSFMAGVLIFFSFYENRYWLVFLGSFLLVVCRMSLYYLNHVDDQLVFENEKETIRLSIDDNSDLVIKLSQFSRLPIYRGILKIKLDSVIEGRDIPFFESDSEIEMTVPFHLKGKARVQISLPIKAVKRGVTRIKSLSIIVENSFGFGSITLEYNPFIHKEIIVYPTPVMVPLTNKLMSTKAQGDFPAPSSLFEQILAPVGTRDYVYTDSFKRVNWKASAKTQRLQTKVFERTTHYSWTFIINLRIPYTKNYQLGIVENVEEIASNVAYLGQLAIKKDIEFEVFINLRMAGGKAIYHLPIGGGKKQLVTLLEALARIHHNGNTLPVDRLFYYVENHQHHSPVVIYSGPFEEDCAPYLARVQKKGQKVYILHDHKENPTVVPFGRN